jgi:hypothetical protein
MEMVRYMYVFEDVIKDGTIGVNRDASASINGYFYQFELTLLHILENNTSNDAFEDNLFFDSNNTSLYRIEAIEDYTKYFSDDKKSYLRFAQIKYHSKEATNSKYYKALAWLYCVFLKYKSLNKPNLNLKMTIFHHDDSPNKDNTVIKNILDSAIESISNSKKDSEKTVLNKIDEIGIDCPQYRTEFGGITSFVKTQSRADVTDNLKEILNKRYSKFNPSFDKDVLYALAMDNLFKNYYDGNNINVSTLDSYFQNFSYNETNIVEGFYKNKIIDLIICLIDSNLEDIDEDYTLSEHDKENYLLLYKLLKEYFEEKFCDSDSRRKFLDTVIVSANKSIYSNSIQEYNEFLKASQTIEQFFLILSKILYYFIFERELSRDINDYIKISENGWTFTFPEDRRGESIIIGNTKDNIRGIFFKLIDKHKNNNFKPRVWYIKNSTSEFKSNVRLNYEIDITKPSLEIYNHQIFNVNDSYFYLQCLDCLSIDNFNDFNKILYLFKIGCRKCGGINGQE